MIASLISRFNHNLVVDNSKLFDETNFYPTLVKDLRRCHAEVIIESPFMTTKRVGCLLPELERLKAKRIRVAVVARNPITQDSEVSKADSLKALAKLLSIGVHVIFREGHHRKVVIIDRKVVYEGSLNVLSQNKSLELMRRTESVSHAWQMIRFIKIDEFLS